MPPDSSTTIAICACRRCISFSSSDTRLLSGTKYGGAHQRRHRRLRRRRQRDQILDEHDADDVVQVLAVDRHPRVLLFAKQFAQVLQRRVDADRR